MEFRDYVSLTALITSIISLTVSLHEKKIKLGVYLNYNYKGYYLNVYNNSIRNITIVYIKIYRSKGRLLSTKHYAEIGWDGEIQRLMIPPNDIIEIDFTAEYSIEDFMDKAISSKDKVYIELSIPGKSPRTFRLR